MDGYNTVIRRMEKIGEVLGIYDIKRQKPTSP
jgi:hypothetical protein